MNLIQHTIHQRELKIILETIIIEIMENTNYEVLNYLLNSLK